MGADEQELAGPWGWDISNDDFEDIIVADDADEFMELDHMPADDELIAGIASADMQASLIVRLLLLVFLAERPPAAVRHFCQHADPVAWQSKYADSSA